GLNADPNTTPLAWQPLTFGGVARFASTPSRRLALVQLVVALVVAGSVIWLAATCWCPVIQEAILHSPPGSEIREGVLSWKGDAPQTLAENHFLAVAVDPGQTGLLGQASDLQIAFGERNLRLRSLFGYLPVVYSPAGLFSLERDTLGPWWGAWQPALLVLLGVSVILVLLVSWAILAALYAAPLKLIAFFADRKVTWEGCLLLAAAALLPAALLMAVAIVLYGCQRINLSGLIFAWGIHIVVGVLYALVAVWFLPRLGRARPATANPFQDPAAAKPVPPSDNPFRPPPEKSSTAPKNPFAEPGKTRANSGHDTKT
ncbi:MAG TPA: hypothetical protein VHH73_04030, partial [Verrucomicrobiae bacterium]|nr:hypothetical protein [Verrucomicrobiae bacterium]